MMKPAAAALAALIATAGTADATVILAKVNMTGHTVTNASPSVQLEPNSTAAIFTAPSAGLYVVSFTGECAVAGTGNLLSIGIFVDEKPLPPAVLPQDIFCASNTTPATDGWSSHAVTAPVTLTKGQHILQIRTQLIGGGATSAWLDDFTTVIQN